MVWFKNKRIYSLLLVVLIVWAGCISGICADEGDPQANEELQVDNETTETNDNLLLPEEGLSMEKACEIAAYNSIQSRIDDINILIKEDALDKAREDAAFLGDVYGIKNVLNNRIIKEVKPFEAETNLEMARLAKRDNISSLKFNVCKTIEGLLIAKKELEVENKRLDILFEKYDYLKMKKDQGQMSDSTLVDMEFSIEGKRMDIIRVEEKIETIKTDIKRLLGLPLYYSIPEIIEEIVYEPIMGIDIDKMLRNAFKANTTIFKYDRDIQATEKTLDLISQYYPTTNESYLNNLHNLEQTKKTLEEYKLDIEVNIRNNYSNLLNQKDRVVLAQRYLDITVKRLKDAELKYNNGFITKDVVISSKEAIINAEYQLHSAIYNYMVMRGDFAKLEGIIMWLLPAEI